MAAGGCHSIERTGQVGTETPPTGLKALAPLQGGIAAIFIRRGELEKGMGHSYENEFGVHALACLKPGQPKG